eukprot:611613-Prorocentrum_minimum.AAC.2
MFRKGARRLVRRPMRLRSARRLRPTRARGRGRLSRAVRAYLRLDPRRALGVTFVANASSFKAHLRAVRIGLPKARDGQPGARVLFDLLRIAYARAKSVASLDTWEAARTIGVRRPSTISTTNMLN